MIPGSVFSEALHSEKRRSRKRESNRQDLVFFKGVSSTFMQKKKLGKKPVPCTLSDVTFLEDVLQKGDARAAALYAGKRKHIVLPPRQTDQSWLLVKHKC